MAAGLQESKTVSELTRLAEKSAIREVLKEVVALLQETRNCKCAIALKDVRL